VGITAGSREVPGRNACDRRHTYCIIIIIIIIMEASRPYFALQSSDGALEKTFFFSKFIDNLDPRPQKGSLAVF